METLTFPFHWDSSVIVITVTATLLLVAMSVAVFYTQGPFWIKVSIPVITVLALIWGLANMPLSLEANENGLTIRHGLKKTEIPAGSIVGIRKIEPGDMSGSKRNFGSGGMFGYLGNFSNVNLGKYKMYSTEKENRVLITTTDGKYVVNCRDYDALTSAVGIETGER